MDILLTFASRAKFLIFVVGEKIIVIENGVKLRSKERKDTIEEERSKFKRERRRRERLKKRTSKQRKSKGKFVVRGMREIQLNASSFLVCIYTSTDRDWISDLSKKDEDLHYASPFENSVYTKCVIRGRQHFLFRCLLFRVDSNSEVGNAFQY